MRLVDSHCHLNYPEFADLDAVVARASAAGVTAMQTISTRIAELPDLLKIAERFPHIYASVGTHPHHVESETVTADELAKLASHPKVIGIGETGLDYYYEHSPRELQQQSFREHIAAARKTGCPVIVHSRDAEADTIEILADEMKKGTFPGLIHCFSSGRELAEKAISLGFYISIAGIVTFKKATELQDSVRYLPLDKLLIETDSPYLAPMPHRGKPNEPAHVKLVAEKIAELKDISLEQVAAQTTQNFFALFTKAKPY